MKLNTKKHFSSKVLLIPLLFLLLFIISIILIIAHPLYSTQQLFIEVNKNNTFANTDWSEINKSIVIKVADNHKSGFKCTIVKDDFEPSCLLAISISDNKEKGIDLSKYENLKVYGNYTPATSNDFLRISLKNFEKNIDSDEYEKKYKHNLVELFPSELTKPIFVDFKRLTVPSWWLTKVRDQDITSEVDLTNISFIELSTGLHATPGDYHLNVSALELNRQIITKEKLYEKLLIAWTFIIISTFIILSVYLQFKIRQKLSNKRELEEINESLSIHSEKLMQINKIDEMTNVLNRNGMEYKLKKCLKNKWFPISIVMLDIDYFKKVNDVYGHQKGDSVLIALANILNDFIKDNESVSRFGGEEFLIIMPQQTLTDIEHRLEDLREKVESYDMELDYNVTVSIGAATCTNISGFKSVIEHADKALYEAKNNGRNCVKFFQDSK